MIIHDIEVHDARPGLQDIVNFLTQTGKIRRQDGGGYLEIRHNSRLLVNDAGASLLATWWPAATPEKMNRRLYPINREFSAFCTLFRLRILTWPADP
jgi:hypothetical protein